MIKSGQKIALRKRLIDVDIPECDYGTMAKGFRCYVEEVNDPNEIKPTLERAKNSDKPAVIDVKISYDIPDITKLLMSMGSS